MANARLKLAREKARKRRRGDGESTAGDVPEAPVGHLPVAGAPGPQEEPGKRPLGALTTAQTELHGRLEALTGGRPLPRVEEPDVDVNGRRLQRCHRDFLLQEMEWMAADFAQERKWRLKTARTLGGSVVSHHNKRATRLARQEQLAEDARRRLAARMSRDVRKFWTKIDKIIGFKVKLASDELRRVAMDRHLQHLVAQTERYAAALAMALHDDDDNDNDNDDEDDGDGDGEETTTMTTTQEAAAQTPWAPVPSPLSDSEYAMDDDAMDEEEDDERTIAVAERATTPREVHEELALLTAESALPLDELCARYAMKATTPPTTNVDVDNAVEGGGLDSGDSDFAPDAASDGDDETTIARDEAAISHADVADELARLREESALSLDELRARYAMAPGGDESESDARSPMGPSDDDDVDVDDDARYQTEDDEEDDESTIALAEAEDRALDGDDHVDTELAVLAAESAMSLEELRARYGLMDDNKDDDDDDDGDDAFTPPSSECGDDDDEETIAAADREVPADQVRAEVALLHEESTMSLEALCARYALAPNADEDDSACEDDDEDEPLTTQASEASSCEEPTAVEDADDGTPRIRRPSRRSRARDKQQPRPDDDAVPEITILPGRAGYKRPYLLTSRLHLREYQEAGVHWLLSMSEKRINGILADEMGLGKTIQTITMLAHLACARGIWGPHLIIVPTSCMVNWEMEFKRWCPAFKVLTYFGSAKRRKELRQGWSKQNAFQVCITSYQLVVQDAHCFKRKKWYYLILDEAHNIKNWKSLRWQTLLTFNSQRRLLLTGTPLQNNIMELWALMHFLMPHVFSSRREFTYWFQNPLSSMVEGEQEVNNHLVGQLHGIIRPFVLRRLKKDVAKQMPGKFEHVLTCQLSKRQRFLYEDFISRSSTRRAMSGRGGNVMSMMNVLMQLRKVCNHPDLFEPRPISSPLDMWPLEIRLPSRCGFLVDYFEPKSIAHWPVDISLPNQELHGSTRLERRLGRRLLVDDVGLLPPLPSECSVDAKTHSVWCESRDILNRLVRQAQAKRNYWTAKREAHLDRGRLLSALHEPMLGADLIRAVTMPVFISHAMAVHRQRCMPPSQRKREPLWGLRSDVLDDAVKDPSSRIHEMTPIIRKAVCTVPKARAAPARIIFGGSGFAASNSGSFTLSRKRRLKTVSKRQFEPIARQCVDAYTEAFKRTQLFFPDKRLLQYDCGKLQQLDLLLRELKRGGHRCLIFTQMSSMLNILEVFLNIHGHTYFRLDGSTKVERRQYLMERFNQDEKVFCFILSTRSGGLGINLTGADCVIFYDSDWNPAMDAQAQDRAHRIGQTRDVHIYRLVSEHTVEENILKKAQQKRHLDFLVMAEGQFTTEFFSKSNLRELVGDLPTDTAEDAPVNRVRRHKPSSKDDSEASDSEPEQERDVEMIDDDAVSLDAIEQAMAQLEDEDDVVAMRGAREEFLSEQREFDEDGCAGGEASSRRVSQVSQASTPTQASVAGEDADEDDNPSVDESGSTEENEEPSFGAGDANDSVMTASDEDVDHDDGASEQSDEEDDDDDDDGESIDDEDHPGRPKKRQRRASSGVDDGRKNAPQENALRKLERAQARAKERAREQEEERKLQEWKESVSSLQNFEDKLNPVDRYSLHFREDIDPLYAYVPTAEAMESQLAAEAQAFSIEEIEARKLVEEQTLIADGELITGVSELTHLDPATIQKHQVFYKKERAHVHYERRRRQLTGTAWQILKCAVTNLPFYYNADTREATWEKPQIWVKNEQLETAASQGYAGLPMAVLVAVFKYLRPLPDRIAAQVVCRSWAQAAQNPSLFVRVSASDFGQYYHDPSSTTRRSLGELLLDIAPGDTVYFASGVYEISEMIEVTSPIKLLAAPDAHVELQMTTPRAQLRWTARGGQLCGFHLSRRHSDTMAVDPTALWQNLLHVTKGGMVRAFYCDFDGNHLGNACVAVTGSPRSLAVLQNNRIFHAGSGSGVLVLQGGLVMQRNTVQHNGHSGITVWSGNAVLRRNAIVSNRRFGIRLMYHANNIIIENNKVDANPCGNIDTETSGRRFVIRWNDMTKDEPEDLPHHHGTIRLRTSRIEDRLVVVAPKPEKVIKRPRKPKVPPPMPTASTSTLGIALPNPPGRYLTASSSVSSSLLASILQSATQQQHEQKQQNPVATGQLRPGSGAVGGGFPPPRVVPPAPVGGMAPQIPQAVAQVTAPNGVTGPRPLPMAKPVVTPSVVTTAGPTHLPPPPTGSSRPKTVAAASPTPNEVAKTTAAVVKVEANTESSNGVVIKTEDKTGSSINAPVTVAIPPPPPPKVPVAVATTVTTVTAAAAVPATATATTATATATATTGSQPPQPPQPPTAAAPLPPASAPAVPVTTPPVMIKPKRKRKPKTEKVLVHGVYLAFKDTCEKKGDKRKVKRPRVTKTPKAEAESKAETDAPSSTKAESIDALSAQSMPTTPTATTTTATGAVAPAAGVVTTPPVVTPLSTQRPHLETSASLPASSSLVSS